MTDYKISDHFYLSELVSRSVLRAFGKNALWFIDPRIIDYLEFMRGRFGVTIVNNWMSGGDFQNRGFRNWNVSLGAQNSQHRYGRATDTSYPDFTPDEIRADIKKNWKQLYLPLGITTIEAEVNWVHADMRYIPDQTELFIVNP